MIEAVALVEVPVAAKLGQDHDRRAVAQVGIGLYGVPEQAELRVGAADDLDVPVVGAVGRVGIRQDHAQKRRAEDAQDGDGHRDGACVAGAGACDAGGLPGELLKDVLLEPFDGLRVVGKCNLII